MTDLVNWKFTKGQVAQLVERSPEKAGVGGSIPSLATSSKPYQTQPLARLLDHTKVVS